MAKKQKGKHIHLIGIGGTGISAIARVLLDRGFYVSGSDQELTSRTAELYAAGADIFKGHKASHVTGAQMVVVSSAIPSDNPEIAAAKQAGIPVLKRADLVGSLMNNNTGIAVAGTHGKTTTTGMIAQILLEAELDPTVILGDNLPKMGSNGQAGQGPHFLVEADEYDQMFLGLRPKVGVITNIEYDHPDSYASKEAYRQAFEDFIRLLPDNGRLVICAEDEEAVSLLKVNSNVTRIAYGIGFPITPTPGLTLILAQDLKPNDKGGTDFVVEQDMKPLGSISLRIPGEHNVNNALAAISVALFEGISFEVIAKALSEFEGVGRRFEIRGQVNDIIVVDDYAHHPTEIKVTLAAAKQRYPNRRIWAVWQPHTYSRVKALLPEFATCFKDANQVIMLDIYRSRETDTLGITPAAILKQIKHQQIQHIGDLTAAVAYLLDHCQPNDVILTLNAGDARMIGDWLLDGLRERAAEAFANEEYGMGDEEKQQNEKQTDEEKMFKLDATASQVRRLVDRLKTAKKENSDSTEETEKKDE
ncbi:MAG: UDP-N-acetylmuramate--L-alanine ligase [Anaerolineales bacterium]|nr:UDP-N-acetylmuramate--L-alanine ligase [Anaerolineales bacterium]